MQAALAPRGDARTCLTHLVGGGLEDDRYVVETFRSLASACDKRCGMCEKRNIQYELRQLVLQELCHPMRRWHRNAAAGADPGLEGSSLRPECGGSSAQAPRGGTRPVPNQRATVRDIPDDCCRDWHANSAARGC